ncbi:hypothetical protein ACFRAE_09495 [Sphingobacterium sp. HJSM2_6]|uniref:hypothetical protein n=1 Tax=Sphingobacterium sp. HJSM2_6 TaxID=3366264 RepID=UPI003BDCCF7F
MTKYTINKVFEKAFHENIWKIEVDSKQSLVAIETRDLASTLASFHIFDFNGKPILDACIAESKEWTLDSIQNAKLILKRVGEHTPIQEGIKIIDIYLNQEIFLSYEYILLDVYCEYIHARHRSILTGESYLIDIASAEVSIVHDLDLEICLNKIQYPITYPHTPPFLAEELISGPIWLSKVDEHYLWCFHQEDGQKFNLILALSNLNQLLDKQVVLIGMDKMIPQPYFKMENQVFLMSFNKREIISYLV